jgi:hypothetical protein
MKSQKTAKSNFVTLEISGVEFQAFTGDNTVQFTIPVVSVEWPRVPFLSDEMQQWARDTDLNEADFSEAYEAAQDMFFQTLDNANIFRYLKDRSRKLN